MAVINNPAKRKILLRFMIISLIGMGPSVRKIRIGVIREGLVTIPTHNTVTMPPHRGVVCTSLFVIAGTIY
jgi:hypothetical protein